MKCGDTYFLSVRGTVAPFTGAWIEIASLISMTIPVSIVAPFTGAWIEMFEEETGIRVVMDEVAPFTGAWIEITIRRVTGAATKCRTLHGCVD